MVRTWWYLAWGSVLGNPDFTYWAISPEFTWSSQSNAFYSFWPESRSRIWSEITVVGEISRFCSPLKSFSWTKILGQLWKSVLHQVLRCKHKDLSSNAPRAPSQDFLRFSTHFRWVSPSQAYSPFGWIPHFTKSNKSLSTSFSEFPFSSENYF